MTVGLWYDDTRRHVRILRILGPAGMSSDEEDVSNPLVRRFGIIKREWMSQELTYSIRVLDGLSRWQRSQEGQGSQRGQFPRVRFLTENMETSSRPIPGLPINAYDQDWLQAISGLQRRDLRIVEEPFDFSHTEEIMQYVQRAFASMMFR